MKITYAKNRLRDALDAAAPVMAQTSLNRANDLLAEMQDDCLKHLDGLIAEFPSGPGADPAASIRKAYDTARRMIGVGTVAKLPEIDIAARSLCDAADGLMHRQKTDWEPVRVHIDAIHLMRRPDMPEVARQQLLVGLEALRGRFAPPQPAAARDGEADTAKPS